jgi:hypothetical protein
MKRFIYRNKLVYIYAEDGNYIYYNDGKNKNEPLKTASIDLFYKTAKLVLDNNEVRKIITVDGTRPIIKEKHKDVIEQKEETVKKIEKEIVKEKTEDKKNNKDNKDNKEDDIYEDYL